MIHFICWKASTGKYQLQYAHKIVSKEQTIISSISNAAIVLIYSCVYATFVLPSIKTYSDIWNSTMLEKTRPGLWQNNTYGHYSAGPLLYYMMSSRGRFLLTWFNFNPSMDM